MAVGVEVQELRMVMDTGNLAPLRASVHLALYAIVSLPVVLAVPLIELALRWGFGMGKVLPLWKQ